MLYSTNNQFFVMIIIFIIGFVCGVIYDVFKILASFSGGDKITKNFFDFVATIFSFVILFFTNLKINYGQFRLFIILLFILGIALERFISKILWTKLINKWYTEIAKKLSLKEKFKWTNKRNKN